MDKTLEELTTKLLDNPLAVMVFAGAMAMYWIGRVEEQRERATVGKPPDLNEHDVEAWELFRDMYLKQIKNNFDHDDDLASRIESLEKLIVQLMKEIEEHGTDDNGNRTAGTGDDRGVGDHPIDVEERGDGTGTDRSGAVPDGI